MKRIEGAIQSGKCVIGVSRSMLRDAEVMLALTRRESLPSLALSGPAVAPVSAISAESVVRAVAQPGGVLVLVDPQSEDASGVQKIAELIRRGPHKPSVIVVAKAFNPFAFGGAFAGVSVSHHKARGKSFIEELPIPPAVDEVPLPDAAVLDKAKPGKGGGDAFKFVFTGRDEEVAALSAELGTGGPIVLSGPPGGGRSLLLEHAIVEAGLERFPDLVLDFGTGFDALAARLAAITKDGGSDVLWNVFDSREHTPVAIVNAAIEALGAAAGNEGKVFVVQNLHYALGRQGDFFRKSRLELLLEALLTHRFPLRLVFVSNQQPVFFREAHNQAVRRFEIQGLKGRFLHEIFEAYHAPEFPREKFGPLAERIHGHPFAARTFAVDMRERADGLELLDDSKHLKSDDFSDTRALRKRLTRRLDKLKGKRRETVALIAHFSTPVPGKVLSDLGVSRKERTHLLLDGLLDVVGTATGVKQYRVHALVKQGLKPREIADFDILRQLTRFYTEQAKKAEGVEELAAIQRANRFAELGRESRSRLGAPLPDNDAFVDSLRDMLSRREPRFDLVEKQASILLSRQPGNADAHLALIEAIRRGEGKNDVIAAAYDTAIEQAPVPELFHQAVNFYLHRRARVKAIQLLEKAVELMPDHSRLHTRLAALLLRQGRRPEAYEHLRQAMELDPQLPDAYGLMGMARRDEGVDAIEEAENLLREAVRLAPDDAVQVSRLVGLLLDRARVAEFEIRDALRAECHELIDRVLTSGVTAPEIQLQLARLIREEGGDLERAAWLIKQARKHTERGSERRFRLSLEAALLDLLQGELDRAEASIRELAGRDPSNHHVFAALAQLLIARELYIPAHAEFMRARERTPPNSMARLEYETEVVRLQTLIEAQAAGLFAPKTEGADPNMPELHSASAHRVIRRRKPGEEGEDEVADEAPAVEAAAEEVPAVEAAAEEAPAVEAAAEEAPAVEAAAEEAPAVEVAAEAAAEEAPAVEAAAEEAPAVEEAEVATDEGGEAPTVTP